MKTIKSLGLILLLFSAFFLFACGGGGGGGSSSAVSSGGVGTLSLSLTDEMSNSYRAIYVTIDDVQVHAKKNGNGNNGWLSISTPNLPKTFNLYELANGVREQIGIADLVAKSYTQMRLIIGTMPDDELNILSEKHEFANYVIDSDGNNQELKIPSGIQTGLKIIHGFTIVPNQTNELVLDFLADKSVVVGGNGNWHIKPTIKVRSDTDEKSIIRGWVKSNGTNGIKGAKVSVQKYNGALTDAKDQVTIQASTIADEDGYFSIFVTPLSDGKYNLVVYAEGKMPEYREILDLASGETLTFFDDPTDPPPIDRGYIQLSDATVNNVNRLVTITGANNDQYASVSFRQEIFGGDMIEITSVNVMNGDSYNINLPLGDYSVVAWTLDYDTFEGSLTVSDSLSPIVFDIDF